MSVKVYLSQTSSELQALRPILMEQIRQAGMIPLEATADDIQAPDMLDAVTRKIQSAAYFIAIVTYKRAWEPEAMAGQSLAEIEYKLAQENEKPMVVLLPAGGMSAALRQRAMMQNDDGERAAQLGFWQQVEENGAVYFEDEADLSKQVTSILKRWSGESQTTKRVTREAQRPAMLQPGVMQANDIEMIADKVAEKTVTRLQEFQQIEQEEVAQRAVAYNEALRLLPGELVFGRPSDRSQFRSDIFTIMPFAADFNGVYQSVIRSLSQELNLSVLRGDEFSSTRGSIMTEVWAALNACKFVIADVTGGNDNVYYELGIAHALNKPAILMIQTTTPESVPFDIRHLRYIQYDNTERGLMRLRSDLKIAVTRLVADLEEGWK
jgi:Domain of unknown function (DUF4062)